MESENGVAPGITPTGASAVLKRPNISVDTCPKSAKRPKVSSEEASLLSLDGLPLVLVLVFLVDAPDGVEKASFDYPPFCRSTFPRSDLHVEGLIELGRPRTESSSEFGSIVVKESCLHTQPILSRMNYLERSA